MFRVKALPIEEARYALRYGEFSEDITRGPSAVVMSQDWCPDWRALERWLETWASEGRPAGLDIDVYLYLYNRGEEFYDFLALKENRWGNFLIPYIRYYCGGRLIGESNYVTPEGFLKRFEIHTCQAKESL
ncbi:MAG: hypothetical protein HPY78_03170 [Brevinematales bacterium]|nr:hypothetical protein [Brevinematales bacterium]